MSMSLLPSLPLISTNSPSFSVMEFDYHPLSPIRASARRQPHLSAPTHHSTPSDLNTSHTHPRSSPSATEPTTTETSQDGWLRQDDEFSDEEIDRFDCGKSNNNANNNSDANNNNNSGGGSSKRTIGFVGEGVRIGAGAAAGGGAAVSAAAAAAAAASGPGSGGDSGPRQQQHQQHQQQAFVSAVMFRRGAITEEEMRAKPVLRVLSGYRAVPFPCCGGGGDGVFPVSVMEAMVEKPRRKDTTGDGGGAGGAGKEGSGEGKIRKFKVCCMINNVFAMDAAASGVPPSSLSCGWCCAERFGGLYLRGCTCSDVVVSDFYVVCFLSMSNVLRKTILSSDVLFLVGGVRIPRDVFFFRASVFVCRACTGAASQLTEQLPSGCC